MSRGFNNNLVLADGTASNFNISAVRGLLSGITTINKFGQNPAVASGGVEEIWDGSAAYVFPATALMTYISQKTDQAAMQGQTVEIQGLDASYALVTQNINLDGSNTTTPVILTTALIRCFRLSVLADVVTDQDISVHNTANNQDYAMILAGNNQSLMAIYTIPAAKKGYITNYWAHHNPATGQDPTSNPIKLWMRDKANSYEAQLKHLVGLPNGAGFQHLFDPYLAVTEKTDIFLTSSPVGKAADVSAGFDLYIIDD